MERHFKTTQGYDWRDRKPNYGQHPPHLLIWVKGPAGAVVCDIQTGWYLAGEPDKPTVWSIMIHEPFDDPDLEDYLTSEKCEFIGCSCQIKYDNHDLDHKIINGFLVSGSDWLFGRLEDLYRWRFEGGPEVSWEAKPLEFPAARGGKGGW